MPAAVLVLLQVLLQYSTISPEIIEDLRRLFHSLDPAKPVLTSSQEQAINTILAQIHSPVKAVDSDSHEC